MNIIKIVFFVILMLIASYQDIKKREVSDPIHLIIFIISFIGFQYENIINMIIGALLTAFPLYIAAILKKDSIGGADIKFMAASGFFLGAEKGLSALTIGLLIGIVFIVIYRKIKKLDYKLSFPLIPFLSIGNITACLLYL